jgi:hypothetical protein
LGWRDQTAGDDQVWRAAAESYRDLTLQLGIDCPIRLPMPLSILRTIIDPVRLEVDQPITPRIAEPQVGLLQGVEVSGDVAPFLLAHSQGRHRGTAVIENAIRSLQVQLPANRLRQGLRRSTNRTLS